jgi:hypothetical protein
MTTEFHADDLAFSLASDSLCLFLGAGFSKQITGQKTPSWRELLVECSKKLKDPQKILAELLIEDDKKSLPLEDCAQILELKFKSEEMDLRTVMADMIRGIKIDPTASQISSNFFKNHPNLRVLTTNYDDLVEEQLLGGNANSFYPGKPIPKRANGICVFHVHGSVNNPANMVVTTNDYFKFINNPNYFSKKVLTLMHENTVLIFGYSLNDPNLKAIINSYRADTEDLLMPNNIFWATPDRIPASVKDYYSYSYGIIVIDGVSIDSVLKEIESRFGTNQKIISSVETILEKEVKGSAKFSDTYLNYSGSIYSIVSAARNKGYSLNEPLFSNLIDRMLEAKINATKVAGAWGEYSILAEWLVYLGSFYNIRGSSIEIQYMNAVVHSMKTMSEKLYVGFSWQAFQVWSIKWASMLFDNKKMIRDFMKKNKYLESDLNIGKIVFKD